MNQARLRRWNLAFLGGLLLALSFLGCAPEDANPSKVKFVATAQDRRFAWTSAAYSKAILIKKVHQDQIRFYTEEDHRHPCVKSADLDAAVKRGIMTWLDLLRASFANRSLIAQQGDGGQMKDLAVVEKTEDKNDADLVVILHCSLGRSTTDIAAGKIDLWLNKERYNRDAWGSGLYLNFSTIVHEVGHAFGLGDTYPYGKVEIERMGAFAVLHNPSNRLDPKILGKQPKSIMNRSYEIFSPTDDDAAGINWLYELFVSHVRASIYSCPEGFHFETETGGCYRAPHSSLAEKASACAVKRGKWQHYGCYCDLARRYFAPEESSCDQKLTLELNVSERRIDCTVQGGLYQIQAMMMPQDFSSFQYHLAEKAELAKPFPLSEDLRLRVQDAFTKTGTIPDEVLLEMLQAAANPFSVQKNGLLHCRLPSS